LPVIDKTQCRRHARRIYFFSESDLRLCRLGFVSGSLAGPGEAVIPGDPAVIIILLLANALTGLMRNVRVDGRVAVANFTRIEAYSPLSLAAVLT